MPERWRDCSPQFEAQAVGMVIETGTPIAEDSRDLESTKGILGNRVNS